MDDFGLHTGVNEAALRLARVGRVHAVGCMVGGPQWQRHWVRRLHALQGVDIGLHLDFTEWPLRAESRHTLPGLMAAGFCRPLVARAVRAEIRAQLDAFERDVGRAPDHVDGHRHVHQFAAVRGELLDELARRYSGSSPWLRSTRSLAPPAGSVKSRLIARLGARAFLEQSERRGFRSNQSLLGVYDFKGGVLRYAQLLDGWLNSANDGDLLMCHPATGARFGDPIGAARNAEFLVLAAPDLDARLDANGVTLVPMSRMLIGSPKDRPTRP